MQARTVSFAAFILNAALCAVNVAIYVATGSPLSLGTAIFVGFVAIFCGVLAVRS